jgi:hypothetical protein
MTKGGKLLYGLGCSHEEEGSEDFPTFMGVSLRSGRHFKLEISGYHVGIIIVTNPPSTKFRLKDFIFRIQNGEELWEKFRHPSVRSSGGTAIW